MSEGEGEVDEEKGEVDEGEVKGIREVPKHLYLPLSGVLMNE